MAKKRTQKSMRRELVNSFIKAADDRIKQEQAQAQAQMEAQMGVQPDYAKGLTRADVDNILKSYDSQQEIPKLEQNTTPTTPTTPTPSIADELERMKKVKADTTTPRTEGEQKAIDTYYNGLMEASGKTPKQNTPKVDYKAEIDRMNALKADTSAQRTEGENKAIDEYLKGLTEAQAYVDSQRKATQAKTTKKSTQTKAEKQPLVTVRTNEDGTRNYSKTMSANEQRDYERALEAQARAVGREAKKNAKPKDRVLSANEQRDYERALEAQAQAKEREKVTTQTVNQPMPTRANEKRGDEIITGQVVKSPVPEAIPTAEGIQKKSSNPEVNELVPGYNNALSNPQVGVMNRNGYDLARNAAIAGALYNGVQEQPKVDDSKWLVKKEELDSMMQDENFANDMDKLRQVEFENANQDATVSDEWANEYGAKNITGGYTKDEYYKLLENKYNLSKAQLQDITDTLQYYERENERQQTYQDFYNAANKASNAKFKPLRKVGRALGTLGSYAGAAGSAIEGAWNAGMAAVTGDPRTQSHLFDTTKNAFRSGVSDSYKNSVGYDLLAGLGDLGVGLAMGNAPLVLAGNTAGEATTNAIARGADVNKAGFTGIGAGIADYAFNKVGLDAAKEKAMTKLTEAGVKKFLQANAIAGRTEAMENVLQDFTETVIDNILNGENSELRTVYANYKAQGMDDGDALFNTAMDYAKQIGMSAGTGYLMGSTMQAVPSLTGGAIDYALSPDENYRNKTFWGSVSKVIDRKNELFFDGEKVTSEPVKAEGNPEEITSEPVNNQPTNPDKRLSNVYTKHLTKLKVVDMANSTSRINAEYDTHHAKDVIGTATKNYLENGDEWSDDVVSGKTRIDGDDDVAEATLCLMGLRDQITQAQESNADKSFIASLVSKRDALARKLRFAGTRLGEAVKAFDYFRGTAEGAVLNAQKMYDQMGKKWAKNKSNAKKVELNGKLAAAFNRLNNPETQGRERVQKSFDQIRAEVKNTIDANKASKMFTDADIDYLAHMVENNLSVEELTSLLNTKMATGAFDIPQEAVERVNQLFDKAQQFGENSKQRVDLETQAFWELANANGQKSSVADKFEAWRYLAMLGNPKTHIRNMIGNALFSGVTGISNNLAAAMEAGVDRSTKAKGARETKKLQKLNDRIATLENSDSTRAQKEIPRLTEKAEKLKERAEIHSQGIDRTKSVLNLANAKDRALVKGSNQDSLDNAYRQLTGQKYNDNKSVRNAIKEQKEVFDTKTVNALNNLNNKALTAEDTAAMRFKYSTSLAGWLKANGFDASIFEDEKEYRQLKKDYEASKVKAEENKLSPLENKPVDTARMNELGKRVEKLEQAREYAIKQAEYAAFHEDNAAADFLSKISRDANSSEYGVVRGMGKMLEGVLPFKKTPLNILFSGFRDYSPIGLVRGFTKLAQSKSGKAEVSEALEALAQGITGSALVGIGALLYDKGLLTMSEDDDSKYQSALEGNQNFAIKFGPKGSKYTATIDFAVPSVMPLFLGAQLKKMWDANPENADKPFFEHLEAALENTKEHPLDAAGNVFVAGSRLLSPVAETSMLQGVNNTLESISEGNGIDALANLGLALGTGYLTQGIPTVTGQVARTIDPIRRSTYSSENTQLGRTFDKTLEKIQNKTPFWSMFNEPYLDSYGREQTNSPANTGNKVADYALNFLYQAVSPSYIQKVEQTPADINAWEVYNGLDNEGKPIRDDQVFASVAPLTINGERLSDKDNYNYTKANGETNLAIRNALVGQDWYNALSPLEQNELLKSVDTLTKNYGQYTVAPDSLNVGDELQDFLDASQGYDEKGFATKDLQSGVQSFLENKEAEYNPYGLGKSRYKELKSENEDLSKYQGFKEALDASGAKDSKKTETVWLGKALETDSDGLNGIYFGRGAEGVQKYSDYENARKELDINDSKGAMKAYLYDGGEQGLVKYQEHRQKAVDSGYVTSDGEPNTDRYDKIYGIMQNDNDTKNFAKFYDQMERNKTKEEKQYIPVLESMNLSTEQRGKYAYAMAKQVGKNGQAALNDYGYEGYYLYKVMENVQDLDNDGEIKDDRKRILNEWDIKLNDAETAAIYEYYMKMFYPKKWNT